MYRRTCGPHAVGYGEGARPRDTLLAVDEDLTTDGPRLRYEVDGLAQEPADVVVTTIHHVQTQVLQIFVVHEVVLHYARRAVNDMSDAVHSQ